MKLEEARDLFDLHNGYTVQQVRDRFVKLCNALHPDTGSGEGDLHDLVCARNLLIGHLEEEIPCPQCKGNGKVRGVMGFTACGACHGAGVL